MLKTFCLLALAFPVCSLALRAQRPVSPLPDATATRPFTPPPGLLQSFLKETPNAVVLRHVLGGLSAHGGTSAKFIAIIASDPSHPGHGAKGIGVVLKSGKGTETVYLDYDPYPDGRSDSLGVLAWDLINLAKREEKRFKSGQNVQQGAAVSGQPILQASMTGAQDRPGYLPTWCCPRYTQLNIGLYRSGAVTGVILIGQGVRPVRCRFPGASLGEVVKLIQAGRKYLLEN